MSFWSSEKIKETAAQCPLVEPYDEKSVEHCAYELGLGPEAFLTSDDENKKTVLKEGEQLVIPPGQFCLLLTEESVCIPNNAIGLISIKAGIKFRGLVNVSGFHVDPGFQGRLKFSVYNAGSQNIVLQRKQRVFLLWFCDLDNPGRWASMFIVFITAPMRPASKKSIPPACSCYMSPPIYTEIATRVAVVGKRGDKNATNFEGELYAESLDSLYKFFQEARLIMRHFPVGRIRDFKQEHLGILINRVLANVLRPFLEKWNGQYRIWWARASKSDESPYELQQKFPKRTEFLADWSALRFIMRRVELALAREYKLIPLE